MLGRAVRAIVWAYVVSFPGEEVFELADSGVGAAFGGDAKEAHVEWDYATSLRNAIN